MDSLDSGYRPSASGKQGSQPRKKNSAVASRRNEDTPAAREARIALYRSRLWVNPEDEKCKEKRKGETGAELNIFTGNELTAEDLRVEDIGDDEEE
jgi:hypothetical protein